MSELETLLESLRGQRRHVLGILEGLGEEELRRPVLPSGWSCLGMVRHLTIDDERFWFRGVIGGDTSELEIAADNWKVGPEVPAAEILALYRRECELADAVIGSSALDAAPTWWPDDLFGQWRLHNVREVLLHMVAETACHAGHLDAARELIDGRQWMRQG